MTGADEGKALESLIHDVNSKCSSLKSAAAMLRKATETEKRELLTLMAQEARALALCLADAEQNPVAK